MRISSNFLLYSEAKRMIITTLTKTIFQVEIKYLQYHPKPYRAHTLSKPFPAAPRIHLRRCCMSILGSLIGIGDRKTSEGQASGMPTFQTTQLPTSVGTAHSPATSWQCPLTWPRSFLTSQVSKTQRNSETFLLEEPVVPDMSSSTTKR